jgi:hypothetical protein
MSSIKLNVAYLILAGELIGNENKSLMLSENVRLKFSLGPPHNSRISLRWITRMKEKAYEDYIFI